MLQRSKLKVEGGREGGREVKGNYSRLQMYNKEKGNKKTDYIRMSNYSVILWGKQQLSAIAWSVIMMTAVQNKMESAPSPDPGL